MANMREICKICEKHNVPILEDAAEALGTIYDGKYAGTFGEVGALSFNGNKIITTTSGGMLVSNDEEKIKKAKFWSTQSKEPVRHYEHKEIGYNYRMSNVIAGVVRGQIPYLEDHINKKKAIYERYKEGFKSLPVEMNPIDFKNSEPNYWLSCLIINKEAMATQVRGENDYLYKYEKGKSSPHEILDELSKINAEGRPIWKPMHCQPIYRSNVFVTKCGNGRARSNAYIEESGMADVG
jgi:dTDP-4-amino-4,6-dideoxygalactose transaminase